MGRQVSEDRASRFATYVEGLTSVIGHADRAVPLRDYCVGLLAAEGRKSVEPMAAVTAPAAVSAQHQKLLHFVANAPWSDERVLAKVRAMVVPAIERHGPIAAWIVARSKCANEISAGHAIAETLGEGTGAVDRGAAGARNVAHVAARRGEAVTSIVFPGPSGPLLALRHKGLYRSSTQQRNQAI